MKILKDLKNVKIHFIGIGGIGMSGIAELMLDLGFKIQGSDIKVNSNIERLKKRGIKFFDNHNKKNIIGVFAVVYSSAISKNNSEILQSKNLSIPLISRADMLAELMKHKQSIAVAGSHGKTTTTSLVAAMFDNANFDPTIVNGGIINSYSKNNRYGKSDWMIVEADESDGSFLRLPHQISIITNIDLEHLDYYRSKKNLLLAFTNFINNLPFYGCSIVCIDNTNLKSLSNKIKSRKIITYSKNHNSNIKIKIIKRNDKYNEFILTIKKGIINEIDGNYKFKTNLLGDHNILNATAAIIASLVANVPIKNIQKALISFQGVKRRFTFLGKKNQSAIYDDYAHHPSEIVASYQIAKQISKNKIIVIFQPHRYSRTKLLFNDFVKVLSKIDIVYVLDIYPAGEKPLKNINSEILVKKIKTKNKNAFYIRKNIKIDSILEKYYKNENIIIFMGAGSITADAHNLFI